MYGSFSEILMKNSIGYPDKNAVCSGDRCITYKDLYKAQNEFSQFLLKSGIERGDLILLRLANPLYYVQCFFAVLSIGGVVISGGVKMKEGEYGRLLLQYNVKFIITEVNEKSDAILFRDTGIHVIPCKDVSEGQIEKDSEQKFLFSEGSLEDIGIIHLTSGSCGLSKGVERSLKNLISEARDVASTLKLSANDVVLCSSPLNHSFACGFMRAVLYSGGTLVVTEGFDLQQVFSSCEKYKVTILTGVPFLFYGMVNVNTKKKYGMRSVIYAITGGVSISPGLAHRFKEKFEFPLIQEYGLSEGGIVSFNLAFYDTKPDSVGQPISNVSVHILDEELNEVKPGEVGQIMVKREAVPQKYYGQMELSREVFYKEGCLLTGDIGRLDEDNCLYIMGRKKLMINVAGNKVDPFEVESILLECPKILDCAAFGVPKEGFGEIVKAIVVVKDGEAITEDEIIELCREKLSSYKIPKEISFVGSIPRSESGKIIRGKLMQL